MCSDPRSYVLIYAFTHKQALHTNWQYNMICSAARYRIILHATVTRKKTTTNSDRAQRRHSNNETNSTDTNLQTRPLYSVIALKKVPQKTINHKLWLFVWIISFHLVLKMNCRPWMLTTSFLGYRSATFNCQCQCPTSRNEKTAVSELR
jgi:hypothetical protein